MIKLFRKIRQNLIMENKTSKYLKYAIGEIILVVIGILIALQINNWNEDRKLEKVEISMLIELKSNLETTLKNFKNDTIQNLNTIHQYKKIDYYINEDLPYNPDLDEAFGMLGNWWSPYPIMTGYATLKTKGLDIISNASLRSQIVNMFEFELTLLSIDYDKGEWGISSFIAEFVSKHIQRYNKNSRQYARPNDFESLKANNQLKNIIGMLITKREFGLATYKRTMISIEKLINAIESELKSRQ
jgi:hypothetical protein